MNNNNTKIVRGVLFLTVFLLSSCGDSGDVGLGTATLPRFAYVANNSDNTVSIYTVNAATGQLRHNGYVAAGAGPQSVAVDPSGKFAYVANITSNNVSAYTINASNGALTSVGAAVLAGTNPYSVTVAPSGKFAYVANFASNDVSAYAINPSTGALAQVGCGSVPVICNGSNFVAGSQPLSVAVDPSGKFAYVANNGGSVSAYNINATTGALTAVVGSPYSTGSSSRSVTVDPSGKFVYVVNGASDDVSAFTINATSGALTQIICTSGCSFSNFTAGSFPISVTVDPYGKFAYVANYTSGNVSAYSINPTTGALTSAGGATAGTGPSSVSVDPSGKFAYVANITSNDVSTYSINATTGVLTALPKVAGRYGNVAMAMTKGTAAVTYKPKFAYVANQNSNNISAYTINATSGALTNVTGSPFATGTASSASPYSVTVTPSGKFAYVASSGELGVWAHTIDATTGALSTVVGSPFTVGAGTGPIAVSVDPSGKFVYVANNNSANVSAYTINATTGVLTTVAGSPFAAGAGTFPYSVTTDPTGRFAYTANFSSNDVSAYTINPVSGVLTQILCGGGAGCNVDNFSAGSNPISVTADPTGKFVYVANNGNSVSAFGINALTGALSVVAGSPFALSGNPHFITVDPSGKFLYVVGMNASVVSIFTINATTGALSGSLTAPAGNNPTSVAVDPSGKFAYVTNATDKTVLTYTLDATTGALTGAGSSIATGDYPQTITTTGTIQ